MTEAGEDLAEWAVDLSRLQGVHSKGGLVSAYDLLQLITGCARNDARVRWARLLETNPELAASCSQLKFNERGRGSHQVTPAIDASGVARVVMALPGRAAMEFRLRSGPSFFVHPRERERATPTSQDDRGR